MSFFIRKNTNDSKRKFNGGASQKNFSKKPKLKKKNSKKFEDDNESIGSTDEEFADERNAREKYEPSDEEDEETVQEKRLRLAKEQLEILRQKQLDREEFEESAIARRLKEEHLEEKGRLRKTVAHNYTKHGSLHVLRCKDHRDSLTSICISNDGNFLFSGSKDGNIVKWSLTEKSKINSTKPEGKKKGKSRSINCLALSSDDKFLVVGTEKSNNIRVCNASDLSLIKELVGHRDTITGLVFRKNTHTLYSASMDRCVKVWNIDDMAYIESLFGHQSGITAIDALFKERAITSGGYDSTIRIWKIVDESQLIYNGHNSGSIDSVKLINEENFLSCGMDGQLCVWSAQKKKPLYTLPEAHGKDESGLPMWICSIATYLNTDLVASGSMDGKINLWQCGDNFKRLNLLFSVDVPGCINSLAFTPDGKNLIAAVGQEHRLGRWWKVPAKNSIVIIPLITTTL